MIHVAIVGIAPTDSYYLGKLKTNPVTDFIESSKYSEKYLVTPPATADFVICVDTIFFQNREVSFAELNRMLGKYGTRLRVYDSSDQPRPVLPGGYTSLESKRVLPGYNCSVPYIRNHSDMVCLRGEQSRDLLWSFSGSVGHSKSRGFGIRNRILKLQDTFSEVVDTTSLPMWTYDNQSLTAQHNAAENMVHQMRRSKYVACPRGGGASSFRFFEAIANLSVPVLISDEWVLPNIPKLNEAIVRLPESRVEDLSSVLLLEEPNYERRIKLLNSVYCEYLSPERIFDTVVSSIIDCEPVLGTLPLDILNSRVKLLCKKFLGKQC